MAAFHAAAAPSTAPRRSRRQRMSRRPRGLAALLIVVAGCAGPEDRQDSAFSPPSEAIRANLAPLVILPATEPKALIIEDPWRTSSSVGTGAARGALIPDPVGGAFFACSGSSPVPWVFSVPGVAIAPVAAAIGAIVGPIVALPDRIVAGFRAEVEAAFVDIEPAPIVAPGFAERASTSACGGRPDFHRAWAIACTGTRCRRPRRSPSGPEPHRRRDRARPCTSPPRAPGSAAPA